MLKALEDIDPWDLTAYSSVAAELRLNGVHLPFWQDWPLSDLSLFLTPEPLHHWHKMFWDHNAKCFRHFSGGISSLKQVTGCEHWDIQWYIIAVVAGAVPKNFLIAVQALMDFWYRAQA
ncbi:hypothetical protein AX17_006788 [Amanita inopinata Kibby_2008]|nr:hypothetical protein AX17_006788 [Amanita inopinata Kibby_2008]